jgi:LmbE family N-acetylglucosaminyl deacetylase
LQVQGLPVCRISASILWTCLFTTAASEKNVSFEDDIQQTMQLLQEVKPHQIFAAGDFADPHGTHKVCFEIMLEAFNRLRQILKTGRKIAGSGCTAVHGTSLKSTR